MQRTARLRTGLGVAALAIVVSSNVSQAQSPAGTHLVVGTKPTEPFVVDRNLLGILQGPEWPVLVERYLGPP